MAFQGLDAGITCEILLSCSESLELELEEELESDEESWKVM